MYRFFMTAPARIALKVLGVFLTGLVLIYIVLFFWLRSAQFRGWAQAELSARSGLEVHFEELTLKLPFGIVAGAIQVSKPNGFSLRAARLALSLTPSVLWSNTFHEVTAERPVLEVNLDEMLRPSTEPSAKFGLRRLNVRDGLLVLKRGDVTLFELPNINLNAQNLNLGQQAGIHVRTDVPPLKGEAELHLSGLPRALDVELVVRPQRSGMFLRPEKTPELESKLIHLRAKFQAPENRPADVAIDGQFRNVVTGERHFSGSLNARATIDSEWKEADFTGRSVLLDFKGALGPFAAKLPQGNAAADFDGSYSLSRKTLTLKSLEISTPLGKGNGHGTATFKSEPRVGEARLSWSDIPLEALRTALPPPLDQWGIQGRGELDLELNGPFNALEAKGVVRGDAGKLQTPELTLAEMNFAVPFEWKNPTTRIREAKFIASKLVYRRKDSWLGSAERMQVSTSTNLPVTDAVKIGGDLEIAGGKFSSPDNSRIGENLAIRGPFEVNWVRAKNMTTIDGKFSAESGEILWGKFFTDLKTPKPAFEIAADYLGAADRLDCRRCSVKLLNIGNVDAAGSMERVTQAPEFRFQARSANFLPGGFFEAFLRENLNRQYPVLDKLSVGGQMAFQAQLNGGMDNLTVSGDLSLKGGDLRSGSNDWEIGPVALNLPFLIKGAGIKDTSREQRRPGILTIEKMRFGQTTVGRTSSTVSLFNNELRFHQPLRAAVFGGEIVVGNLLWPNVIGDPKRLSFSLDSKQLQLQTLTQALGWPSFGGTLTGTIPEIQSTDTTLKTKGEIQAELFGGRARISKLEIENPFSSLAAIRLDASLTNIELERLSQTFAFGRISGILEGTIADLVITDGQPAQFGADLHSVDRGGEQRISVEALDKITVLSSGQSAGGLYGGLAGFFDSFRYSKLGFKAILRNDRLTLRGVETRGNQEYLVVGSLLPPTVNIVSHTQTIAFSELVRRLERIKSDKPEVK